MRSIYKTVFVLLFMSSVFTAFGQAPTTQATDLIFANATQTQVDISWTRGDGDSCAVFVFQGTTGTPVPVDNTTYSADAAFGSGDEIGTSSWYCIYNGSGTSVTMTDLTANTNYLVMVAEYNGDEGAELFLITSGTGNPAGFATLPNIFTVSGTDAYCAGTTPTLMNIELSGSDLNVSYQLQKDAVDEGAAMPGTGNVIVWTDVTAGTYTVIATALAGSFSMTGNAVVTENTLPVVSFTGLDALYCLDADTAVLVPNITGGIFVGDGVTNDTLFIPAEAGAGNFTIFYAYSDVNGCKDTAFFDVEVTALPVISMPADTNYCGASYTFDAGSGFDSYLWSTNETTQTINSDTSGTFYVTVTDINGCMNSSMTTLTMIETILTVSDTVNSCQGADVTLTATANTGIIIWNQQDTLNAITVSPMTSEYYYVSLVNGGCVVNDSVYVETHAYPTVSLPATQTDCGNFVLEAGTGNNTYIWTGGTTNATLNVTQTGTYNVTVTNEWGCSATGTSAVTILSAPNVNLGPDFSLPLNQTVILGTSPNYPTYLWSTGATTYSISLTGSQLGVGIHDVWLQVDLANGCSKTDTVVVTVTWALSVEENATENISVYPNPANDNIQISGVDMNNLSQIIITDITGKVLVNNSNNLTENIRISDLPAGMYYITLTINNKPVTKTITVVR
ncbi:MAG: hypothetical protein CVU05_13570 [Bacteroidetes bacterium HGW-Bacteroidetes-21]|jgi:hypothetical protein|nr:MAG: hypothetical protein CVU05_13570 [Bacteroidetes bacterium HGW-Bacteroidetes-21]